MFMPYCIPYIFPGLKNLVSPKMVRHIELPNVGEEPSPPYRPVWSKWHEPSNCLLWNRVPGWSWQDLSSYMFNPDCGMGSFQKLNSTSSWFLREACCFLPYGITNIPDFLWVYSSPPWGLDSLLHNPNPNPKVNSLILLTIPRVPSPHQSTRVMFIFMNLWQHLLTNVVVCF